MFTLFFVVVRKGYCLPTSYRNVGIVSVLPTCLPSFMHPSILVRELHKLACPIVMYGPKLPKSKVFTKEEEDEQFRKSLSHSPFFNPIVALMV